MSFPRYPSYKDSGVELVGEIPVHWNVARIKNILRDMGSGGTPATDDDRYWSDDGYPWVAIGDMSDRDVVDTTAKRVSASGIESKKLMVWPEKTLLFSMYASLGHVSELGVPAATNQAILALLPSSQTNQKFLKRWFEFLKPHLRQEASSNTQDNLNAEKVRNLPAPTLPLQEQQIIAAFLDRETAKIDALVAEQENLIALLKEKRQAVISHAVTKGLDPTVPMKDSGIEWLGEVPAHWDVAPLKRDLGFLTSGSRGWADHYADEGAIFIRIGNLTRGSLDLDLTDLQRVEVPEGVEGERTLVRPGDIIFSITAYLGSVAVIPAVLETAYVSQHVALARLARRLFNSHWVGYVTLSFIGTTYFDTAAYGGTKIQLSLGDVADLPITTPPLKEQLQIVNYLETETAKLDTLTTEAQRAIDLLKERRSALISAAVTGKIDVRGYHAQSQPIV